MCPGHSNKVPTSLKATLEADRIVVRSNDQVVLVQNAAADTRPYLHPIQAPDGLGTLTEDAPPHHPWQHGLYVGLNDVNGVGFWEEGIRDNASDGSFHPEPLTEAQATATGVSWQIHAMWRDPDGKDLLRETQAWRLQSSAEGLLVDMEWTLAAHTDLTFGDYGYGGLFLRMPYRKDRGGSSLNSEGQSGVDAEGQRARWVAVAMHLDGRETPAGIAILDHPNNADHPVPWRGDGQLGISPSRCIAGAWNIAQGASSTSRYRVLAFTEEIDALRIERVWGDFAT